MNVLKKYKNKSIFAWILTIVLIMGMTHLPQFTMEVKAVEDETKYSSGHFYYHSHDGYVSICGYLGRETEIVIPSTMSGRPVAEIESGAFNGCNSIEVITIPDTVVLVYDDSFTGAASLKKIISNTSGVTIVAAPGVEIVYAGEQTVTPDPTATPSPTATQVPTTTATPSPTATQVPTATATPSPTATQVPTATATPRPTATVTPVPTATATPRPTATVTPVPTATATLRPTATVTPVPTVTATPRPTATVTPVPTATVTPMPTATTTPVPTAIETPGPTATINPGPIVTDTPVIIVTETPAPTATVSQVPTVSTTPVPTSNTPVPTATIIPDPVVTPQITKTVSVNSQVITENGDKVKITGKIYKSGKISLNVTVIDKNGKSQKIKYKNVTDSSTNLVLTSFKTSLSKVVIPTQIQIEGQTFKITAIGAGAFSGSKKLKSIEIGSNITEIAEGAFDGIRSDATFRLKMTKKQYKTMKSLLKKSGLPKTVKFKRVKP